MAGVSYIYDALNRLIAVVDSGGDATIYEYDAVGNLLSTMRQPSSVAKVVEFSPHEASEGSSVSVYGTGFSEVAAANVVRFNGVSASIRSATSTEVRADVPAGATSGPITVETPSGSAISAMSFAVRGSLAAPRDKWA